MIYKASKNPSYDPNLKIIQAQLNSIRLNVRGQWPHLNEDGYFGSQTELAVKGFQNYYKSSVSGVIDETTLGNVRSEYNRTKLTISASKHSITEHKIVDRKKTNTRVVFSVLGEGAGWGALAIDEFKWPTELMDKLPRVYVRMRSWQNQPLFMFNKKAAYRIKPGLYRGLNVPKTLTHHWAAFAWLCQVILIWGSIKDYNQKKNSLPPEKRFSEMMKIGGSALQIITGAPEAFIKIANMMKAQRLLLTGAPSVATSGVVAALSRISAYIGAFMLGYCIGEFIGSIKVGNDHNVQYYIDDVINKIWEHPYQTIGMTPNGLVLANVIAMWKEAIDLWVNRVNNLKTLTPQEKALLNQQIDKL